MAGLLSGAGRIDGRRPTLFGQGAVGTALHARAGQRSRRFCTERSPGGYLSSVPGTSS